MKQLIFGLALLVSWSVLSTACDAQFSNKKQGSSSDTSRINSGRTSSTGGSSHDQSQRRYNEEMMRKIRQQQKKSAFASGHRAMPYGTGTYYRQPPVKHYYVAPQRTYANPYPNYDQGYGYYVRTLDGRTRYVPPTYNPHNPYYRNYHNRYYPQYSNRYHRR